MSKEIDDLLNGKIRSPSLGDKLFVEAEDWWMSACLNWYNDPTELYIVGYKKAADSLVDSIANRKGSADSLIFPIVFLYRHYVEIRLKSLLHDGNRLLDREHKQKSEHQLSKLWPKVRSILDELWPNEEGEDLKAMDSLIAQFEEVDPRSTTFRYPKDFDGNNSLKLDVPRVNLRNLAEVVGAMSIILEGAAGAISDYQGYKNGMQSDCW
ncbi:hypothetical protein N7V09_18820 [Shewanella seohaensis]|uniref:hypothetical protein n=1 Tax=Shewanella seohaensis TaxID=755175 RepID=UPI00200E0A57|nr:hypothetical protein [Shewanella seohaensis]MCL1119092.1 hypothetical protein [Shewanella seohaensis]UXM81713.1 hypothetical protein N7V09_18820 [Shewanella seohaensis]